MGEAISQAGKKVQKMEDQNCAQVLENYKLELTVLTDEVAKMNLEIQELKKKKEKKEDEELIEALNPVLPDDTTPQKKQLRAPGSSNQGAAKNSGQKQGPRVSNDGAKCGLCKRLTEFGIKPKDSKHHLTLRGNTEPESCGHLRDLNIQQMAELFKKYEMCRVCAYRKISDAHHEDKCNYTKKVTLAKCQVKSCSLRYFLCAEHEAENENQIKNRMEYYKSLKFPAFNFSLCPKKHTEFKLKQQEETRDVSTQTADNYDSTKTDEIEPETELKINSTSSSPVVEADQETRSDSDPTSETESESEKEDADLPVEKDSARFIPHQVNLDK